MLRIVFVGWGAIARRSAELLLKRNDQIQIVGIATRRPLDANDTPPGTCWVSRPEELRELSPDIVIEAAGREAVEEWASASLRSAPAFIVSSTSALTDDALLQRLLDEAREGGSQIWIPPGALAGVDALAAASRLSLRSVVHRIIKPPRAWKGTPAEKVLDLDALAHVETFFRGTAREAGRGFPANANVAVISALAGVGIDRTVIELVADPGTSSNSHHVLAEGDFGRLDIRIENRSLAGNPKSSELAALSLVRLVENRISPISL